MYTVEIAIQKTPAKPGAFDPPPETVLSVAFVRDSLAEALLVIKRHLALLEEEG